MTVRLARLLLCLMLWGAAFSGATQLHRFDLGLGHGICGPWGCAASAEALAGAHLLWLLLIGPAVVIACRMAPPANARRLAMGLIVAGLLGAVAVVAAGSVAWWLDEQPGRYVVQRGLFVLLTTPDLPVLPLALAGLAGYAARRRPAISQGVEAGEPGGENPGAANRPAPLATPPSR